MNVQFRNLYTTPSISFNRHKIKFSKTKLEKAVNMGKFATDIASEYNTSVNWVLDTFEKLNNKKLKTARRESVTNIIRSPLSDSEISQRLNLSLSRIKDLRCGLNNSRQLTKQKRVTTIREGLANGRSISDIANELGLKENTIKIYIRVFKINKN